MYWVVDCLSVGGAREPEVEINEWSGKIKSRVSFAAAAAGGGLPKIYNSNNSGTV